MSATKFTPGPWVVNPITAQVDVMRDDGPLPICLMLWPTKVRSEAETEANANLIAAAPEMYESLRSIVENWDFEHGDTPVYDPDIVMAREALKKARGES